MRFSTFLWLTAAIATLDKSAKTRSIRPGAYANSAKRRIGSLHHGAVLILLDGLLFSGSCCQAATIFLKQV